MTAVLGIDPGLHGAVALLLPESGTGHIWDTPSVKVKKGFEYLVGDMRAILVDAMTISVGSGLIAYMEEGRIVPRGEAARNTAVAWRGIGLWEGLLAGMEIPYTKVAASVWKREFALTSDKNASRVMAQRLFPALAKDLTRVKDADRAEAALIAEYGSRRHAS